jgi:hypothetical protein
VGVVLVKTGAQPARFVEASITSVPAWRLSTNIWQVPSALEYLIVVHGSRRGGKASGLCLWGEHPSYGRRLVG